MRAKHRLQLWSCLVLAACTPLAPGDDVLRDADGAVIDGAPELPEDDAGALDQDPATGDAGGGACPPPGAREIRRFDRAELLEDTLWTCHSDYEIDGFLTVSRGTLRVSPGVQVRFGPGAFLLVGNAARLEAVGEPEQPIVFSPRERPARPGAFRGLMLLGKADTSLPNSATLGLPAGDSRAFFGGADDEHDCGELRHVRVEFAGGPTSEYDLPAAALTLAGCGSKTIVDSVQVHAATDGIGLIGGRAPLKRVLVSVPSADGIEWSAGYRGFIQFAVVQTFHGAGAAIKGSNSLSDFGAPPGSAPYVFNATLVGARSQGLSDGPLDPNGYETGVLLQGGSGLYMANSLVLGFAGSWLDVIGEPTAHLFAGESQVVSTIFADSLSRSTPGFPAGGVEPGDGEDDDGNFVEDSQLRDTNLGNRFFDGVLSLRAPFARPPARPDFSADGIVDGGNLRDSGPAGWAGVWEPAFYAGALPTVQLETERVRDWTMAGEGTVERSWTSFPSE